MTKNSLIACNPNYTGDTNEDGLPHGHGVYEFTNGGRYEGQWKDGKYHGQGTMTWPDGESLRAPLAFTARHDGSWTLDTGANVYVVSPTDKGVHHPRAPSLQNRRAASS